MSSHAQKIGRANMALLLRNPFYAQLLMRLEFVSKTDPNTTIDTNGRVVNYSPAFIDSLPPEEVEGVFGQMGLHLGFGHHARREKRDHTIWNIAADVIANHALKDSNLKLPKDALYAEGVGRDFGLKPQVIKDMPMMPVEKLYDILQNTQKGQKIQQMNAMAPGSGDSQGGPSWGQVNDATGENGECLSEGQMKMLSADAMEALTAAAQSAKQQGKLPGSLEQYIGVATKSKVDWARIMFEHVQGTRPQDYSFRRSNRRYADEVYVMPTIEKFGVGVVVVGVDTSGSVSDAELSAFLGEVQHIIDMIKPEKVVLVPLDAQVHEQGIRTLEPGEEIGKWKAIGRGGTDMTRLFPWLEKNEPEAAKVIIMSDLYTPFPEAHVANKWDLLWVSTSDVVAPVGQTVHITL